MNVEMLASDSRYLLSLIGCGSDKGSPLIMSLVDLSKESVDCHESRTATSGASSFVFLEGTSIIDQQRLARRSTGDALGRLRMAEERSGVFANISRSSGNTSRIECGRSLDCGSWPKPMATSSTMTGAEEDTEETSELPSEWVDEDSDDEETGRRRDRFTVRISEIVSMLTILERFDELGSSERERSEEPVLDLEGLRAGELGNEVGLTVSNEVLVLADRAETDDDSEKYDEKTLLVTELRLSLELFCMCS